MFDHCLYFNTTALARQLEREWAKAFESFDLTPPQAFLLRTILDKPGLLQGEYAKGMVISRPTATRALDGLMAKSLIVRKSSERDGREQSIFPTAAAIAMATPLVRSAAKGAAGYHGQSSWLVDDWKGLPHDRQAKDES